MTMRWVLVHLVEEIARHAAHADILRDMVTVDAGGQEGASDVAFIVAFVYRSVPHLSSLQ